MRKVKLTIRNDMSIEIYDSDNKISKESNLIKCIELYYKSKQNICIVRPDKFDNLFTGDTHIKMINLLDPDIADIHKIKYDFELFECFILVPFRARGNNLFRNKQLHKFIKHIVNYMKIIHTNIRYNLIIIEQTNNEPFNRGFLLNIGFNECEKHTSPYIKYYIHHNCDLFPDILSNKVLDYSYPGPGVRDIFGYEDGLGGICVINKNAFKLINGFPNNCLEWSTEDEIIKQRCERNNIKISRPIHNEYVFEENHIRDTSFQKLNQINTSDDNINWKKNGLTSLIYKCTINKISEFKIDNVNLIHYFVDFSI